MNLFKPVCSAEKIYIHKGEGKVEDLTPPAFNIPNIQAISPSSIRAVSAQGDNSNEELKYTKFLETFLPPSVVIDENDNVVHFFGMYDESLLRRTRKKRSEYPIPSL